LILKGYDCKGAEGTSDVDQIMYGLTYNKRLAKFEIVRIFQLFQQDTVGVCICLQEERAGVRECKTEGGGFF
jgi:hypothetical protein